MSPFILAEQLKETALDYLRTTFHLSDPTFESRLFEFPAGVQHGTVPGQTKHPDEASREDHLL